MSVEAHNYYKIMIYMRVSSFSDCDTQFNNTSGGIYSYGYHSPDGYPNHMECIYTLVALPGKRIFLEFVDFDVEHESKCRYDYVQVGHRKQTCVYIGYVACITKNECRFSRYFRYRNDPKVLNSVSII